MSLKRSNRLRRPLLERLERRTMLSAVVTARDLIWPTNQVPYLIDPSITDPGTIVKAINEYNVETTVQWIPRTNQEDDRWPVVGGDSYTAVGDADAGGQGVTLSDGFGVATVLHEMGHTLGLYHEQSRNDRNAAR